MLAPVLIALLAACSGPGGPDAPAPVSPWAAGDPVFDRPTDLPPILGVNYHPLWDGMDPTVRADVLDAVKESGVGWVRMDIGWHNIQPTGPRQYDMAVVADIDEMIREARARDLQVALLFYWAPVWASGTPEKNGRPRDPQQYAAAASWVAARYDGHLGDDLRVDALELWNEPDLNRFWAQEPAQTRISDFATLIRVAGAAVRQANPDMTVVTGGLSALDVNWLRQFYAADPGVGTSYQAIGLHAYPSPSDQPPEHFDVSHPQYSVLTVGRMADVMTAQDDPATVWVTEFGWSSHPNIPLVTQAWERGVSEDLQAAYLLSALKVLGSLPRVQAAFWYTSWSQLGEEHMDGFSLLDSSFAPKPAYFALKCAATGECGP